MQLYAWQFQDGTYRISFMTNGHDPRIFGNKEAFALYDGVYPTRKEAEDAIARINAMFEAEKAVVTPRGVFRVGDLVHVGFGVRGGAGFTGRIVEFKDGGRRVVVRLDYDPRRLVEGLLDLATKM